MIRKNAKIGFNLGSLTIAAGNVTNEGNSSNLESNSVVVDNKAQDTSKDAVGFGSFGKIYNEVTSKSNTTGDDKADDITVETNPDIARVMGFTGFGNSRKAKNFDMAQIMEEAKRKAQERNIERNQQLEQEYVEIQNTLPAVSKHLIPETKSAESSYKNRVSSIENESKGNESNSSNENSDEDFVGPPIPDSISRVSQYSSRTNISSETSIISNENVSDDEKEDTLEDKIPKSHECRLEHGSKAVSALAIDPSGSRLTSGSIDYDVKFWDFAGMDASLKSFRSIRPCESHVIRALEYSSTGDKLLVIPGSWQAKGKPYVC